MDLTSVCLARAVWIGGCAAGVAGGDPGGLSNRMAEGAEGVTTGRPDNTADAEDTDGITGSKANDTTGRTELVKKRRKQKCQLT